MKRKRKRVVKAICITLAVLTVLILTAPIGIAAMVYRENFGSRYETADWAKRSLAEFDGLQSTRYTFPSGDGQRLVGYRYAADAVPAKALVVLAHGLGGGGHNSYMDVADYLAKHGYPVFAYDATGNDESAGDGVNGLPQGVIDLDYAIRFVQGHADFDGLPILLFGHSWGAYSAGAVLNVHPKVRAVVMVAGFNRSLDMMEEEGRRMMGDAITGILPYFSIWERLQFGRYAKYDCLGGFAASVAGVMLIQSADDDTVSYQNGLAMFRERYGNDLRFTFVSYEDRGHNDVYDSDAARQYRDDFNRALDAYLSGFDVEQRDAQAAAYRAEHLDKAQRYALDAALMDEIIAFYDRYAGA